MTATTSRGAGNKDKGADDRAVDRAAATAKQDGRYGRRGRG